MAKTKTPLNQSSLNTIETYPILDIEGTDSKSQNVIKAKAVVIIDPVSGKALQAQDFFRLMAQQADAVLNQNAPADDTYYPILSATNVRIQSITVQCTWTVQPNPISIELTLDGVLKTLTFANPVSATWYEVARDGRNVIWRLLLWAGADRAFLMESRSVLVRVKTTGGTVQNISARICYQQMT